jgi:hypothetical protein
MKPHEAELRKAISQQKPFALVTQSGERVKVRSHDHIFLPPFEDENGKPLRDVSRSDFFEVWSNGLSSRWVAFKSINIIEIKPPRKNGGAE